MLHLSPHLERLSRRIEHLDTPLVQVWGWPGSGKSGLLAAFLSMRGAEAAALPLGDFDDPGALRQAVDAAWESGARWLVAAGRAPEERLRTASRRLRPGQSLVFASERRVRGLEDLPAAILPPQELLPTVPELAELWRLLSGTAAEEAAIARLHAASDGWYRPLLLALEATGGAGLEAASAEDLLDIAPVRFFLRHEVLEMFTAEELAALLAAPEARAEGEGWQLLDERGLWVEGPESDCMPRLLAAVLERERRRRGQRPAPPAGAPRPVSGLRPPAAPDSVYSLGLLGPPFARRRDAGGRETELEYRLRRSFQVLAYLASSPGLEASREDLVEAIWPTEGEHTIERNFHPTLSHLRRALEVRREDGAQPQPLLFRGGIYRLNPEVGWEVDALELVALVEKGKQLAAQGDLPAAGEAWRRAWGLYRGPFLPGHYEAWVVARRETYQRLHLEMLRELGDLYLRLQRADEAMDAYRSILVEDPLQERIHVALMQVYADQGRRDMVRRQYDRLCTLLLEELGVEPMAETTREYHRLMS